MEQKNLTFRDLGLSDAMLKALENKLKMANNRFASKQLWNSYSIVVPDNVRRSTKKEEADAREAALKEKKQNAQNKAKQRKRR